MSCIHVNGCGCPNAEETPLGQVDASQVFYHALCNAGTAALTCLGLANGVSLETFMETVSTKMCENIVWDWDSYNLECLKKRYVITNQAQFVSALDNESCRINTINDNILVLQTNITDLSGLIQNLTFPQLSNNCNIPFDTNTSLVTVLQNWITHYCNFVSSIAIPDSPAISANNSSTISWALSGLLNHTLQAGVILSPDADNILEIRPNGLYAAADSGGADEQELTWDPMTNTLSISNGNSVLLTYPGAQTLSFDTMTGIISLSGGGGSIDLSTYINPTFTETALAVTLSNAGLIIAQSGVSQHNLQIGINLDAVTNAGNNIAQVTAAGLYVPPTTEHNFAPVNSTSISWNAGTIGNAYHDRTASVIIDPIAGNLLQVGASGLFVLATTTYTGNSGLTLTANNFQLGGTLLQHTSIALGVYVFQLLATTTTNNNFQFDDLSGLTVYQAAAPLVNTSIVIETDIIRHRALRLATNFDYLKVTSTSAGVDRVPKVFAGVAVSAADSGKGPRFNLESSFGMKVVTSTAATLTLTENHVLYVYLGQATAAAQNLTLPDPSIAYLNPDGESISWILYIKNFSSDPADVINTNHNIYSDDTVTVSVINAGEVYMIGIVNGKWTKLN